MCTDSHLTKKFNPRSAFTLIEVMLVLILLVAMGAITLPMFFGAQEKANVNIVRTQATGVKHAIERFRLSMNKYPEELQELWEEPEDEDEAANWDGPYLDGKISNDPWGNEYEYLAEGEKNSESYDFWSNGPDGDEGTEDDIGNWEDDEE
jgi:general secretion pathway protein G